jgi:cardiolipin synthase A/B
MSLVGQSRRFDDVCDTSAQPPTAEGFHAKFLLWGDDDLIVTSLNWCSWTTSPESPRGEIGVHIRRTGIARDLTLRLKFIWPQL